MRIGTIVTVALLLTALPASAQKIFVEHDPNYWADFLRLQGSLLVPGWNRPEGVVWYHCAGGFSAKVLLEGDDVPKGQE